METLLRLHTTVAGLQKLHLQHCRQKKMLLAHSCHPALLEGAGMAMKQQLRQPQQVQQQQQQQDQG